MPPEPHQRPHAPATPNRRVALLRLLLPLLVVACAAALAFWLMKTGPKAKPRPTSRNATVVDVRPVEFDAQATTVTVMGTVIPRHQVVLKPQVSGRIITMSGKLIPGGHVSAGDPLLTIDPSDYRLTVQQLASEVARVEADLQIELGKQRVAQKEFELLGEPVSAEERALMLREPQLANLRAVLEATRARLAQARLDLERTEVRAPFNAVVISRDIDLGASVSSGSTLATLVGSDSYWIEAAVPTGQLQWIRTGDQGRGIGAEARIFDSAAWGEARHRPGRVTGLTATVEEQGRMAKLLVEVPDPLALQAGAGGQPRLLLGSYVRVEVDGTPLPDAVRIERELIRDGSRVWIMDGEDALDVRTVEIAFRGQEHVLVTGGVSAGERLITSNLPSPVQGMKLRVRDVDTAGALKARP